MSDLVPQSSDFLLYVTPNGEVRIEVFFQNETVWLTQKKMAELFGVTIPTVNEHLKNIFSSGELLEKATIRNFLIVQKEGARDVSRNVEYYNLDAIIAVGYRVNSKRATQFRVWATQILKEYMVKGFALDDDRLKQAKKLFGQDYFQELLERIRAIRASERRIYQQITDIFAECSIDYDQGSDITKKFYAMVQNKFHFAIIGQTAAEKIYSSANASEPNMGLKTWKNSPKGRVLKSDTNIAKNYLDEKEVKKLERIVSSYFDYLEHMVENRVSFKMEDLAESIDKFLTFNEYKVLGNAGKISADQAEKKAFGEYEKFKKIQDKNLESDFDREVKKILNKSKKK